MLNVACIVDTASGFGQFCVVLMMRVRVARRTLRLMIATFFVPFFFLLLRLC